MTIIQNIKAKIYNQLVDIDLGKLAKDEFRDWFSHESNDQRVSIDNLYSFYSQAYDKAHRNTNVYPSFLPYPFKPAWKRESFRQSLKDDHYQRDIKLMVPDDPGPSDLKIKPLKQKYSRKSFSPSPWSWEIDHLEHSHGKNTYLLTINSNTRYGNAYPVHSKSLAETIANTKRLISDEKTRFSHTVRAINGDDDRGFNSLARYFPGINFYFFSSSFTFHNKLIDRVIRTLRDAMDDDELWDGNHNDLIQQLVWYYNHSWHMIVVRRMNFDRTGTFL